MDKKHFIPGILRIYLDSEPESALNGSKHFTPQSFGSGKSNTNNQKQQVQQEKAAPNPHHLWDFRDCQ